MAKKRLKYHQVGEDRHISMMSNDAIARVLRQRLAYPEPEDELMDASMVLSLIAMLAARIRHEQYQNKDNYLPPYN